MKYYKTNININEYKLKLEFMYIIYNKTYLKISMKIINVTLKNEFIILI